MTVYFMFPNRCEIDSSEAALYINISSSKQKLMFEMLPGYHTQHFVDEIFRLTESLATTTVEEKRFEWIDTYVQGTICFQK